MCTLLILLNISSRSATWIMEHILHDIVDLQVVCGRCSNKQIPLEFDGFSQSHRVCDKCFCEIQNSVDQNCNERRVSADHFAVISFYFIINVQIPNTLGNRAIFRIVWTLFQMSWGPARLPVSPLPPCRWCSEGIWRLGARKFYQWHT